MTDMGSEIIDFLLVYAHTCQLLSTKILTLFVISTKSTWLKNIEYLHIAVYV